MGTNWLRFASVILVLSLVLDSIAKSDNVNLTSERHTLDKQHLEAISSPKIKSQVVNYEVFNWVQCHANYNQVCDGSEPLDIPLGGWQICKVYFTVANTKNDNSFRWIPSKWFEIDPVLPVSFARYTLVLHARGVVNGFNFMDSNIRLEHVGLTLIASDADNLDRHANGCRFENAP
jgi:hypothetical protein